MNKTEEIIRAHAKRYPLMQPCDAVKLLYQNEFGCGHMISDPEKALAYIIEEAQSLPQNSPGEPPYRLEEIGNGFQRLHLSPRNEAALPLSFIGKLFLESSRDTAGKLDTFCAKLELLRRLVPEGIFCFSPAQLDRYLSGYQSQGYPAVHHSKEYTQAYHPAYRVIHNRCGRLLPVIGAINRLLEKKGSVRIGIDGMAASGKTTAADLLSQWYGAPVIHMDDFFLPPALRSEQRYQEPGGNVHYERFAEEVLPNLAQGKAFAYRIFDCHIGDFSGERQIPSSPIIIVEGAYCLHPSFQNPYDLRIFSSVEPTEQLDRIQKRNGKAMAEQFARAWIPLENKYFAHCSVRERCELVLD